MVKNASIQEYYFFRITIQPTPNMQELTILGVILKRVKNWFHLQFILVLVDQDGTLIMTMTVTVFDLKKI